MAYQFQQTGAQIQQLLNDIPSKYVKPATGIPATDLTSALQTSVENADNSWDLLEALGLYRDADGYICERS